MPLGGGGWWGGDDGSCVLTLFSNVCIYRGIHLQHYIPLAELAGTTISKGELYPLTYLYSNLNQQSAAHWSWI